MPSATCLCSASSEWRPGTHWSRQRSGGHHTRVQRFVWVVGGGFSRSGLVGVALRYLALRPVMGVVLPHAAPVQGVSRPPHAASRDCRNGSPLARAIPCAPAPECGDTREKENKQARRSRVEQKATRISACAPTRSAASRAGMARHQTRQPRNSAQPQKPGKKQHATTQANRETAHHQKSQPSYFGFITNAAAYTPRNRASHWRPHTFSARPAISNPAPAKWTGCSASPYTTQPVVRPTTGTSRLKGATWLAG